MKNKIVTIPTVADPIKASPGFAKKLLSEYKLDIMGLCGFGCLYCSSNTGNYLRINREKFADITEKQLDERVYPAQDPSLSFKWDGFLESLERQVNSKSRSWGEGKTLVFSMLTDGFSPWAVNDGLTEAVLRILIERTSFRVRVLTKNAIVGSSEWIQFFLRHQDRFVVGLSTGTLDDEWARKIEVGTSLPSARFKALRALQDAGVATYGMLCPVFPDMLVDGRVEELVDAVRPERCEHVWAEPYNDRVNWKHVRDGYALSSMGYEWMTKAFERKEPGAWSEYASKLYAVLIGKADNDGWAEKLRYMLYEEGIREAHAPTFAGLRGLLLQSPKDEHGNSKNPHFSLSTVAKAKPVLRLVHSQPTVSTRGETERVETERVETERVETERSTAGVTAAIDTLDRFLQEVPDAAEGWDSVLAAVERWGRRG